MIIYLALYKFNSDITQSQIVYLQDTLPVKNIPAVITRLVSEQLRATAPTINQDIIDDGLELVDFKRLCSV